MARLHKAVRVVVLVVVLLTTLIGTAAASAPGYIVQPGDTLYRISVRFGVSMDAIRAANGFTGDRIYSGQNLIIPDGSAPSSPSRTCCSAGRPLATTTTWCGSSTRTRSASWCRRKARARSRATA